jgi:hypothetical protein
MLLSQKLLKNHKCCRERSRIPGGMVPEGWERQKGISSNFQIQSEEMPYFERLNVSIQKRFFQVGFNLFLRLLLLTLTNSTFS